MLDARRAFGSGRGMCELGSASNRQTRCWLWTAYMDSCRIADLRAGGLEEYIEGLSFWHYLDTRELITLEQVQRTLSDEESGEPVSLGLVQSRRLSDTRDSRA